METIQVRGGSHEGRTVQLNRGMMALIDSVTVIGHRDDTAWEKLESKPEGQGHRFVLAGLSDVKTLSTNKPLIRLRYETNDGTLVDVEWGGTSAPMYQIQVSVGLGTTDSIDLPVLMGRIKSDLANLYGAAGSVNMSTGERGSSHRTLTER